MSATSLYDELAMVPDPRGLQGLIHPLPAIMGLVALALLMGRKSLTSIARFLVAGQKWKGLKQGLRITRERTVRGKKTVEVVYGITSLSMRQANAATLLAILRDRGRVPRAVGHGPAGVSSVAERGHSPLDRG